MRVLYRSGVVDDARPPVTGTGTDTDTRPALLDRIDALRILRADTPEEKGRLLEEIGGPGQVEQDIVR